MQLALNVTEEGKTVQHALSQIEKVRNGLNDQARDMVIQAMQEDKGKPVVLRTPKKRGPRKPKEGAAPEKKKG